MSNFSCLRGFLAGFAVISLFAQPAAADPNYGPNLVTDGDFSQTTMPNGPSQIYSSNSSSEAQLEATSNLTGWGTTGYNFIFNPASAASIANGSNTYTSQSLQYGPTSLWAPGSKPDASGNSVNGFVNPPSGGNFIGADGAYEVGAITQTLTNLQIGRNYLVAFQWAAAQQQGFDGATTEAWTVSLGKQSFSTPTYSNVNHGFSGWMAQSFTFTANATTEALSFLASGTPGGEPPFSLLSGVSAEALPEPTTLAIMTASLALFAFWRFRQRT